MPQRGGLAFLARPGSLDNAVASFEVPEVGIARTHDCGQVYDLFFWLIADDQN